MHSGTKLTAKDAADAKTLANLTSRLSESSGRHPGPGFGQEPGKRKLNLIFLNYQSNPGYIYIYIYREKERSFRYTCDFFICCCPKVRDFQWYSGAWGWHDPLLLKMHDRRYMKEGLTPALPVAWGWTGRALTIRGGVTARRSLPVGGYPVPSPKQRHPAITRLAGVNRSNHDYPRMFPWFVGRILVRDVFHWVRVAETSNCWCFCSSLVSVAVSFMCKCMFWNLVNKKV